jgi:hypothetical protein
VKPLLFEAMADRAAEIAKHLPAGGSARAGRPETSASDTG